MGHETPKCKDLPKKGNPSKVPSNSYQRPQANKEKEPKKIWVPKIKIIPIVDLLDSKKETLVMVPIHMIVEKSIFQSISLMSSGVVTFRGNQKGLITGVGKVCIPPYPPINNVLFVKGLKHNLLSISQLCNNGYNVTFNKDMCIVQNKDNSSLLSTKRQGNLYKIKLGDLFSQKVSCLLSIKENHWVWHKKLGHASLRLISKLQKHSLVRGLPKLSYQDDSLCEAC